MGSKSSKKIGKIILWILLGLLALDLLLVGLLFVPAIQTFAVNKITKSISEKWGTELSIKDVRLTPSLRLVAHELRIHDDHHNDMIYVGTVNGRLRGITMKPFKLKLGNVTLEDANVVIRKYKGDPSVNISMWAKKFTKKEVKGTFLLTAQHLNMVNSRFVYINDEQRKVYDVSDKPPVDYAYLELKDINWEVNDFIVLNDSVAANFNHLAFNQYSGFRMKDGSGSFSICGHELRFDDLKILSDRSVVDADLLFTYDNWYDYGEFLDSVRITSAIRHTILNLADVADFVGSLRGMSETLRLSADRLDGCVNDFNIINLLANCGYSNRIHGDLALKNITELKKAYLNVQLDSCKVDVPSLAHFSLPGGKHLKINKNLSELGQTDFDVAFVGTLTDFNTEIDLNSAVGDLSASVSSLRDSGEIQLQGNVQSDKLNLAKLTNAYKTLGSSSFNLAFDGSVKGNEWSSESFKTLEGSVKGDISHLGLYSYPLRNMSIEGEYKNRKYDAVLTSNDPNLKCDILAQLDITGEQPMLQGNVSIDRANLGVIANLMPKRDSITAKGLDRVIYTLQNNPTLETGFDNLTFNLMGSNIDNVSGYVGCDNIRVYNNGDSLSDCRFRVTSINTDIAHKFIVSSNIANASLETNYPLACALDSIKALAHNYFPSIIDAPKAKSDKHTDFNPNGRDYYITAHASTYRTHNVLKLIFPDIYVAPNSTVDVALYSNTQKDEISADVPFFFIRDKVRVHHLSVDGHTIGENKLNLNLTTDSLIVGKRGSKMKFDDINLKANSNQNNIDYDLTWNNFFNKQSDHPSNVAGIADISNTNDLVFNLKNTIIYLNDLGWKFNNENAIHLKKDLITVNNLIIDNDSSHLYINGDYSTKVNSDLNVKAESFNLSLLNPLLSNMSCGGLMSADVHLRNGDNRFILGKVLADDFVFNDETIGDLFVVAGWNDDGQIGFNGGFFHDNKQIKEKITARSLATYDIQQLNNDKDLFAKIQGTYVTEKKALAVHTTFDTLNAGFLDPFLSGFSDHIKGTASGNLSFYSNPESTYFDGVVTVLDANMGISALGTNYFVRNQDIRFTQKGIFFDNMKLSDEDDNQAVLHGSIKHKMFKDMLFDLKIITPGIMVLNTPKSISSPFYGKGYASGQVSITGNDKKLYFRGPNLETLAGTKIYLQVSSANSVSESNIIHFKLPDSSDTTDIEEEDGGSMELDFDFTFNVTDAADIVLLLESIGGTMNARANGNFRLTYNDADDLNLYGALELHSGDFRFSLYNLVNSRFTLVPGGSITFDGPLDNMVVHASAYKSSKTSLASIVPQEYLTSTASSNVNAYLHLDGEIMKNIDPTFSFELPNSSNEVRNLFYNAIDTTNKENMTKQFAYFMITNNFMPNNLFSNTSSSGNYTMLSNFINNMLGNLMDNKNGSFGVIYNQATESTSAEYGIKANANILKDRVSMSTSIGYYDDKTADAANNMYGDFTVEYNINKAGTWKVKAYTYVGEHDENYYNPDVNSQINYTAGVALAYKQSFDSRIRRKIRKATIGTQKKKTNKKQ